jgi:hypothetical protein
MGRYPDLRPALPTNFVKSTTTARLLTPAIVFAALLILLATSIAGLAIPGAIFARGTHGGGVKAAQVFFLLAVSSTCKFGAQADLGIVFSYSDIHRISPYSGVL